VCATRLAALRQLFNFCFHHIVNSSRLLNSDLVHPSFENQNHFLKFHLPFFFSVSVLVRLEVFAALSFVASKSSSSSSLQIFQKKKNSNTKKQKISKKFKLTYHCRHHRIQWLQWYHHHHHQCLLCNQNGMVFLQVQHLNQHFHT
jgi:hypothetical protein